MLTKRQIANDITRLITPKLAMWCCATLTLMEDTVGEFSSNEYRDKDGSWKLPPGAVQLDTNKVTNVRFWISAVKWEAFNDEQRVALVHHEWAHVSMGHLDKSSYPEYILKSPYFGLVNIAQDLIINNVYDPELVKSMGGVHAKNMEDFEIHPWDTWITVFNKLVKLNEDKIKELLKNLVPDVSMDGLTGEDLRKSLGKLAQSLALAAYLKDLGDDPNSIPDALKMNMGKGAGSGVEGHVREYSKIPPKVIPDWLRRLDHIIGTATKISRGTSWRREGRWEWVKGSSSQYRPAAKVLFAADASGSIDDTTLAEFRGYARIKFDAAKMDVVSFDSQVYKLGNIKNWDGKIKGGGGTEFQPVFDAAAPYDLLIMATDGENWEPRLRFPNCAIIWIYTPQHSVHPLRSKDKALVMGDG